MVSEIVLLSGGYDSAILLHRAHRPLALFVDYGQRAVSEERASAKALAARRGCELVQQSVTMECGAMNAAPGEAGARVVGGRNAALIALGVNLAVARGAQTVWIGAQAGDADDYPDCRHAFIAAMNRLMRQAYGVSVEAPLLEASSHGMRAEAAMYRVRDLSWSCYAPSAPGVPCGSCNSCRQVR